MTGCDFWGWVIKDIWLLPCCLGLITLGEASNHVMRALRELVERATCEGPEASCPWPALCARAILEAYPPVQPSLQVIAARADILTATAWETLRQTTQISCFRILDPEKLWDSKCLLFWATMFWDPLLYSKRSVIQPLQLPRYWVQC